MNIHFPLPLRMELKENGRRALLLAPFVFRDWKDALNPGFEIEVPAGFQTDFNSVPRGLWNFFPPWEYPEAGVVHDYLYVTPGSITRREADAVHRRILELKGCSRWKRWAAWLGIRTFGRGYWNSIPD